MTINPAMLQFPAEIERLAEILKSDGCQSLLEIGSNHGGSLWALGRVLPHVARIVAVDMPDRSNQFSARKESLRQVADELRKRGNDVHVIWDDSTAPVTVEKVKALGPFHAVFIDANHQRSYVTKDWENYGALGRIVAFHDIAWRRAPEWKGQRIEVPEVWNEIKGGYRHEEIKLCPTGKNNGIGVLWRQ